jgi:kynurenine formamidase
MIYIRPIAVQLPRFRQGDKALRKSPTQEQVFAWFDELSNWGRWGPQDSVGTLNLVHQEVTRRGTASVRHGERISCAWPLDVSQPKMMGLAQRFMRSTCDEPDPTVPRAASASEALQIRFHGSHVTHLDGLAHMSWDRKLYNGRSAQSITTSRGATQLGMEVVGHFPATRGVLLDVAAARGVERLELGDGAFPEDLEAAEERQGLRVEPGDAVLLGTGFSRYRREHPGWNVMVDGASGWHAASLPWLRERGVAIIATEGSTDVFGPAGAADYPEIRLPVHVIGIVAMGLWLIDNCNLERLTERCVALGQWTFLFTVAPLRFRGATGSPVNPIALL